MKDQQQHRTEKVAKSNGEISISEEMRLDQQCVEFESLLRADESARIEDFLVSFSGSAYDQLLHQLLLIELDHKQGKVSSAAPYVDRFPQHANIVTAAFKEHQLGDSLRTTQGRTYSTSNHSGGDLRPLLHEECEIPTTIGRYQVERELGIGGFGRVFLARDEELDRQVAIKVPHQKRFKRSADVESFMLESRTLASLDHSNIVPVYDFGRMEDGRYYVVSKYIEGEDLSQCIQTHLPSTSDAVELVAIIAETLDFVHQKGVVHRDIKPSNLLLALDGRPHVADFGLAVRDESYTSSSFVGTPQYASPEQARGEGHLLDGRSDQFSLGVVFYELLAGITPFRADTTLQTIHQVLNSEPTSIRQIDDSVPFELERICFKAISKRASDRYETCGALAQDLRQWLESSVPAARDASSETSEVAVVPKGLRCFDQQDAGFFLNLLPGPRDRNGLPESIRRWRHWVEQAKSDNEHRLGVIYGPSGSGKSSLVRAGLLPLLDRAVMTIVVSASPSDTPRQLLDKVHRGTDSDAALDASLPETLAKIRRGDILPSRRKLLIVIDQFEQWLHGWEGNADDELLVSLRQCDAQRVQCLLLVRDDFWLRLSRFMTAMEIPLQDTSNAMLIDLFDSTHAKNVLTKFGQAFGRLPEDGSLSSSQQQFVKEAVSSLSDDGRISPVRLAVFSEMVKDRTWDETTSRSFRGSGGVGRAFLDDQFFSERATARNRSHQRAASNVLVSLLPEVGSDIKTHRTTRSKLLEASGYKDNRDSFGELLQILDSELRLISPIDAIDPKTGESSTSIESQYQLTHDYLVPSIREWFSLRQKQTLRGRLQLQLEDRSSLWASAPEQRFLPKWTEWAGTRLLTSPSRWTKKQREMMRAATFHHGVRTIVLTLLIVCLGWFVANVIKRQRVDSVFDQLSTVDLNELPNALADAKQYEDELEPRLAQRLEELPSGDSDRIAYLLVLIEQNAQYEPDLFESTLQANPDEIQVVLSRWQPNADSIREFWATLTSSTKPDQERLAAGLVLANVSQPENAVDPNWLPFSTFLLGQIVDKSITQPQFTNSLSSLSSPLKDVFRPHLIDVLGQDESTVVDSKKINLLVAYFGNSPEAIVEATASASTWQLPLLLPFVTPISDEVAIPLLEKMVDNYQMPTDVRRDEADAEKIAIRENAARQVATAAALLVRRGQGQRVMHLLRDSQYPTVRSYLIHSLRPVEVPLVTVLDLLDQQNDNDVRAALVLAVGEYAGANTAKVEVLKPILSRAYSAGHAGLHGAASWTLREWNFPLPSASMQNEDVDYQWRINGQGQTLVRLDARNVAGINRVFEIAAFEITVADFRKFDAEHYCHERTSPTSDCPMNVVTWAEAVRYCEWLNQREGLEGQSCYQTEAADHQAWTGEGSDLEQGGYRLPTVAEWEYACSGIAKTVRHFADDKRLLAKYSWHDLIKGNGAKPVGSLKPNRFGLFDFHGNISEWCHDLGDGGTRAAKGKCYSNLPSFMTVLYLDYAKPDRGYNRDGFRICRTIPTDESSGTKP